MLWYIIYIIGVCLVYGVFNHRSTIQDENEFFAYSFFERVIQDFIMIGQVVFWPIWLAWLALSVFLGWLCWVTGFDATNRQRIFEGIVIVVLFGWLFISQLWDADTEDEEVW